jgi:Cu/Ag efflux protein CusF
MRMALTFLLLSCIAVPAPIIAQTEVGRTPPQPAPPDVRIHYGTGLVNEVDVKAGRINLKHGPIEAVGWPARTADFVVADREQLAKLRPGQSVRFELKPIGNEYVISNIYAQERGAIDHRSLRQGGDNEST